MCCNYVLHTVAVGFHHRLGATVEIAYPPFVDETQSTVGCVPATWKHLASLSLPDGAHKFLKDTIYFTLPSIEKEDSTVFCVASYHQVHSASYSKVTPDVTRNTVQKSLVVLCRVPLFTFIAHHLTIMVESLFQDDAGFTMANMQRCHLAIESLVSSVVQKSSVYREAIYCDLGVDSLFRAYGRDVLVLYKAVLLERRILFDGESAGWLCNWILTLLSLFPGVLENGLTHSAIIDANWIDDPSCHCSAGAGCPSTVQPNSLSLDPSHHRRPGGVSSAHPIENGTKPYNGPLHRTATFTSYLNSTETMPKNAVKHGRSLNDLSTINVEVTNTEEEQQQQQQLDSQLHTCVWSSWMPSTADPPFPTNSWGFPLALFTKSSIVPIYLPLCHLDTLLQSIAKAGNGARCVRSFLACATNPLLRTHRHLADLIVTGLPQPPPPPGDVHFTEQGSDELMPVLSMSSSLTVLFGSDSGTVIASRSTAVDNSLYPIGNVHPGSSSESVKASRDRTPTQTGPGGRHRAFNLASKRPSTVIRFTSPDSRTNPDLRALPLPLNQALQLTRYDRAFADRLCRIITSWYSAKEALGELTSAGRNSAIDCLPTSQKTILLRFTGRYALNTWIRQKMASYLCAVLLTAYGYGESTSHYGTAFITCLRASHSFLVWKSGHVATEIISIPRSNFQDQNGQQQCAEHAVPETCCSDYVISPVMQSVADAFAPVEQTESVRPRNSSEDGSQFTSAMFALLTEHPGHRYTEADDWEQLVSGVKRFGNMAAGQGRRLVNQSVAGFSKLATDQIFGLRGGHVSSGMVSRIADAFKGFLTTRPPPSDILPK